jgi:hypothetical protein
LASSSTEEQVFLFPKCLCEIAVSQLNRCADICPEILEVEEALKAVEENCPDSKIPELVEAIRDGGGAAAFSSMSN